MIRPRRRGFSRLAVVASVAAGAVFVPATFANACTCAVHTVAQQVSVAEMVFVGTARSIATETPSPVATRKRVQFDVSTVYKGSPGQTVTVSALDEASECGVPFAEHRVYAVFAVTSGGRLVTDLCSGTTDNLSAVAGLTAIGRGNPNAEGPASSKPAASRASVLAIAAVLLGAVVGATTLARRAAQRPRPFA